MAQLEFNVFENDWWWGHSTTYISTDGKAIVEIAVSNDDPEWGCVRCLMVHESVQRQGIGTQIMQKMTEEGIKKGLSYLYLDCRKDGFIKHWYERFGYVDKGEEDESGGLTIQMQKRLKN